MHLLCQPVHLPASVTEDDGLSDSHRLVEVAQSVQLPFLLFDGDVELLDTLQSQLVPLDENPNRLSHKLLCYLEYISRHSSREEDNLDVRREELEDLVDLVLETAGQHLICFIETEHFDVGGNEGLTADHIEDTTGCTDDDRNTSLQLGHVFTDVGTTDTGMAFDIHVVAESNNDFLNLLSKLTGRCDDECLSRYYCRVEFLEDGDGKGCSLASTRLSLSDDIVILDYGDDCTLLDSGRTLKTIGKKTSATIAHFILPNVPVSVDTTEKVFIKVHVVEASSKENPSTIPSV